MERRRAAKRHRCRSREGRRSFRTTRFRPARLPMVCSAQRGLARVAGISQQGSPSGRGGGRPVHRTTHYTRGASRQRRRNFNHFLPTTTSTAAICNYRSAQIAGVRRRLGERVKSTLCCRSKSPCERAGSGTKRSSADGVICAGSRRPRNKRERVRSTPAALRPTPPCSWIVAWCRSACFTTIA